MNPQVELLVDLALKEDIGRGDITTSAVFSGREQAEAAFIAKESGVIAGIELADYIFRQVDENISFTPLLKDGDTVQRGDIIAEVKGSAGSILTAERTTLNFMQRMSGIATKTKRYCDAIAHTNSRLLDTRKTMPGQRYLDKWAVRLGGGKNHRHCLDDMYLIKENHIAVAGGVRQALEKCRDHRTAEGLTGTLIEIEIESGGQLEEVLEAGIADIILLDNMSLKQLRSIVGRVNGACKLEASGNVTIEHISQIAETGVDFISSGSITHSVHALDISLLFE